MSASPQPQSGTPTAPAPKLSRGEAAVLRLMETIGHGRTYVELGEVLDQLAALRDSTASLRAAVTRYLAAKDDAEQFVTAYADMLVSYGPTRLRYAELHALMEAELAALRSAMEPTP